MCFGGEGTVSSADDARDVRQSILQDVHICNRKLEDLSLETILTVIYTIHHILVHIVGPCLSSIFATFLFN